MASNENPKTVLLAGDPVQYEGVADAAIVPGTGVVYGAGDEVSPGAAETLRIARERGFIGGSIDEEIPEGDNVPVLALRKGDRAYCLLADGGDVARGAALELNASGQLAAVDQGTAVAVALEAVAASGGPERIRVEAL